MNEIANRTEDISIHNSIFRVGEVISVEGRDIRIKVDKSKNTSHLIFKGELLKNINVGGYVKIKKGFIGIIAKVEGEYIKEEKLQYSEYAQDKSKINRILSAKLLGFIENSKFHRGIKELPLIGNNCYLLDKTEFKNIHEFVKKDDLSIKIGTLALEKGQDIEIGINSLFSSHFGVFGNTGSGKSYTLSKLYHELYMLFHEKNNFQGNANFFLLDFNGEYIENNLGKDIIIENEYKSLFELSTAGEKGKDKYPISEEIITETQFWSVLLQATEKTQMPFINRSLSSEFLNENLQSIDGFKNIIKSNLKLITTQNNPNQEKGLPVSFLEEIDKCDIEINGLSALINDYRLNLEYHSKDKYFFYTSGGTTYYSGTTDTFIPNVIDGKVEQLDINIDSISKIQRLRLLLICNYFFETAKGYTNKEHIAPLIGRLDKRIHDLEKVIEVREPTEEESRNFIVVSLKDVNIHMRKILPLLLCKQIYDKKKKENNKNKYLNLIVDEAHNILSHISERESESWKDYRLETFEEIIKEGRKFGVFMTIASQRPYDISPTIISQIHNFFLHRLINVRDLEAVSTTISYLDKVSIDALPILPTGTCILSGQMAQVPAIVAIDKLLEKYEPYNKTINLIANWNDNGVK